ncbi:MAG TPA: hypothetical protein VNF49_12940 [Candidatus Binataceae bacterium]|nr:hypothetical protein [Candidatus Binataceae bacterium]
MRDDAPDQPIPFRDYENEDARSQRSAASRAACSRSEFSAFFRDFAIIVAGFAGVVIFLRFLIDVIGSAFNG